MVFTLLQMAERLEEIKQRTAEAAAGRADSALPTAADLEKYERLLKMGMPMEQVTFPNPCQSFLLLRVTALPGRSKDGNGRGKPAAAFIR